MHDGRRGRTRQACGRLARGVGTGAVALALACTIPAALAWAAGPPGGSGPGTRPPQTRPPPPSSVPQTTAPQTTVPQTAPPETAPPGTAPPASNRTPATAASTVPVASTAPSSTTPQDAATTHLAAERAALLVAKEATILLGFGAFGASTGPGVATVQKEVAGLALVSTSTHTRLASDLATVNADVAEELGVLQGDGIALPLELQSLEKGLSQASLAAADAGHTITYPAVTMVYALDDLALRDGRPEIPARTIIDPTTVNQALRSILATAGVQGATTTSPRTTAKRSTGKSAGHPLVVVIVIIVVVALIAAALGLLLTRRRRDRARRVHSVTSIQTPGAVPRPAATVAASHVTDLLEVSRRLASITSTEDMLRAVCREAMGLVPAVGAALVVRVNEHLALGHQTQAEFMRPDRLGEGIVARVSDTGQAVVQVSATEPAIRTLPAALVAVPLVSNGRVEAVLVMARSALDPFQPAQRDLLMALTPVAAAAMQSAGKASAAIHESTIDALTGLRNRRRFDEELPGVLAQAGGHPTSVVMFDVDHFKSVNDTYGHPVGDLVLRGVGEVLRTAMRPGDGVYRYGGEEFVLVLPNADGHVAVEAAERIRLAMEQKPFDIGRPEPLHVTVSLGVAWTTTGTAADLVLAADGELYSAKHSGRNRVSGPAAVGA